MSKFLKIILILIVSLGLLTLCGRQMIKAKMGNDSLNILDNVIQSRLGIKAENRQDDFINAELSQSSTAKITLDSAIIPFREIGKTLGDLGRKNSGLDALSGGNIFDANGDGKLDLFLAHTGRSINKAENEDHVLDPTTPVKAKPCALFLNQGNDENGDPIFKSVQELLSSKNNGKLVKEELLFENKYRPRTSIEEDPYGVGRVSASSIAGDFNGDGRMDLLILNSYYGSGFGQPELGLKVYPANANLGRKSKEDSEFITTTYPPFLAGDLKDGRHIVVNFGEKPEKEGRNTLLLNLGDQDGDGIPEWKDVTNEAGMNAANPSTSGTMADIDRDGDLDIYVANFLDPDFWGFGTRDFAGSRNELWINQLAETGELKFKEVALEYGVAGLHKEEDLPSQTWNSITGEFEHNSRKMWKGEQVGEEADHSWATQLVDYNDDGYPDLFVMNDVGNMARIYENQGGKGFKTFDKYKEPQWNGAWMGLASGDLDGDMNDEIFLANFGSNSILVRNTAVFAKDPKHLSINASSILSYMDEQYTAHHTLLSFEKGKGLVDKVNDTYIEYPSFLIPDGAMKQNISPRAYHLYEKWNYNRSIAGLEFSYNPSFFDIENDGDLDIYIVGSLGRGNDGFIGDWTNGPGRMLVNETTEPGSFHFKDKTLEYRLLDIAGMNYDANPPYRPSPGTNWHKKDKITLHDRDSFAGMGIDATRNSKIRDIFRMHENTNGSYAADLNGDGFTDLVVSHLAGYNSTSPDARNLKINFAGKNLAVPAPNKVVKAPTSFEEGQTFVYINQNALQEDAGNWVKLKLQDNTKFNSMGIGAKVIVNDRIMRRVLVGGESFGSVTSDLTVGLGQESLRKLEIRWGSGSQESQIIEFDSPRVNEVVIVERKSVLAER